MTELIEFLKKAEPRFEHAPVGMVFEQEQSYAVQIFKKNPYLESVAMKNPDSLLSAMSNVANIGLSLNPAKAQAYLIPRNIKINGRNVAFVCFDPSYRGLCDIATGTGCVLWVQAEIVREADTFALRGVNQPPSHERDPFKTDRGKMTGAYCVAKLPCGDYLTTCMSTEKIHSIRAKSEMWKSAMDKGMKDGLGPWKDFPEEMSKKTVVRNAFKMWPKSKEFDVMSQAVHISNENEGFEPIVNNPEITKATPDQKEYYDGLITNNNSIGMFCFTASIDPGVETDLYNSFESKKTQYKKLVDSLQANGRMQIMDCREAVEEAAGRDDDLGVKEIIEDLSQEAVDWIKNNTDDETRQFITSLSSE